MKALKTIDSFKSLGIDNSDKYFFPSELGHLKDVKSYEMNGFLYKQPLKTRAWSFIKYKIFRYPSYHRKRYDFWKVNKFWQFIHVVKKEYLEFIR